MKKWNFVNNCLPENMVDVLIVDSKNRVRKGFLNLGGVWVIQNTKALSSLVYRDEKSIIAWTSLPKVYKKYSKEGWKLVKNILPQNNEPVLISTESEVFISHVRSGENAEMWWLKNKEDSKELGVYVSKSSVVAWMPLPKFVC